MKKALALATLAAVAAAAFLLFRSQAFDDRGHQQFQSALWSIRQLDATFRQDVLRSRFSMLNTYDDFEASARALDAALVTIGRVPGFVEPDARAAIGRAVAEYRGLLQQRDTLVEHFKSQNAVVANSRRYLPLAVAELSGNVPRDAAGVELAAALNAVARAVLRAQADPAAAAGDALAQADALREWAQGHHGHAQASLALALERHARTLVTGSAKLDALTADILTLPTTPRLEHLIREYDNAVLTALRRAQQYRGILYVLGIVLLAGIGYAVWSQRSMNQRLEHRVEQRTRELAHSEQRFRTLATAAPIGIFLTDANGDGLFMNPHWQEITGLSLDQSLGTGWQRALHPDDAAQIVREWADAATAGCDYTRQFRFLRPDGEARVVSARTAVVRTDDGNVLGHVGTVEDITERRKIAVELQQVQKLEAVGRLAAGVAHEINTPVQFVNDSCHFLRDGLADLKTLVGHYRGSLQGVAAGTLPVDAALAAVRHAEHTADVDFLLQNMPEAIDDSLEGLQRVSTIVRSMKEFAHPDRKEMVQADLNQAIQSTLVVARNEYKYVADVHTDFADLPPVACFLGDLNQAVLNIVVNAAHAIEDVVRGTDHHGTITVRTARDGNHVVISIADTGTGIPDHVRDKIFDPFFTTKEVGKGTGQGLAIARSVVVDKHHGSLTVDSAFGQGTTFTIRLPIEPANTTSEEIAA